MKVSKVINNNVVSSVDEKGREIIVMGKGVGFQKKPGDTIADSAVEKIFSLPETSSGQFADLVKDMPYEHIQLAEEIIAHAKKCIPQKLNKNIYITLTDHLNYAIERQMQGITIENAFLWEIKKYYHTEYQVGMDALEMVKKKLGIALTEHEAAFLALHFVNAEMDANMSQSISMPGVIRDIIQIIETNLGKAVDENSLSYERLVTHLKFFLQRIIKKETYKETDELFLDSIRSHCRQEYLCACQIREYIREKLGHETSDEELMYLTLHIRRVANPHQEV